MDFTVFQEPRGIMRLFQVVFSICAFAVITNYHGLVSFLCSNKIVNTTSIQYPFYMVEKYDFPNCSSSVSLAGDFSSDAKFFVTTGVLSMLYALGISAFYVKFDDKYKSNALIPMIDFGATVVLAIFWLSGSAAWANALTGLQTLTSQKITPCLKNTDCVPSLHVSSFSSLYVSIILGFLNFFLWASDLWFVYKETEWFQPKPTVAVGSPTI